METRDEEIRYAIKHTEVLKPPKQALATFGTTLVNYYLLTNPVYADQAKEETVIRKGKVSTERPRIVTPSYLIRLEGFADNARRYLELMIREHGPNALGVFYQYKNEPADLAIVTDPLYAVAQRLADEIDKEGDRLTAIISGVDALWDVSLLKFVRELTESSVRSNLAEFGSRGLLDVDRAGVPSEARYRIEELFGKVAHGEADPSELKAELDSWGLFQEYQDRFFALFRKRTH